MTDKHTDLLIQEHGDIDTIPYTLAHTVTLASAQSVRDVGNYVNCVDLGDGVVEYHFLCLLRGYECWHWVTTLYHDIENNSWTVNETTLQPAQGAILSPKWIPWKDRLQPEDLSPVDVLGTDPQDYRMQLSVVEDVQVPLTNKALQEYNNENLPHEKEEDSNKFFHEYDEKSMKKSAELDDSEQEFSHQLLSSTNVEDNNAKVNRQDIAQHVHKLESVSTVEHSNHAQNKSYDADPINVSKYNSVQRMLQQDSQEEYRDLVKTFQLTRRHVMTAQARMETAQRWYEGPPGPKSLSTRTAQGEVCSNCAFFLPLQGELHRLFGVCANKWSPEDAKVVSIDHGCGEHSEIEPMEPTQLWIQSEPAYDSLYIDVVQQVPRDENDEVEIIEERMRPRNS